MLKQEFELISTLNTQQIHQGLLETVLLVLNASVVCKVDLDIKQVSSGTNGYFINGLWCTMVKE